ncbi:MAG: carboxymuconolactone decarboxylase family protein [Proteobacteria bacterium]|nr:carboxymuconolactone decarboxylase family protein [Pseudomonadota bacterium]
MTTFRRLAIVGGAFALQEWEKMARIEDFPVEQLADELKPLFHKFTHDYGDFTNQAGVLAHSPEAFRHLYGLLDEWRSKGTIPRRLVEIAVVTASRINECDYCVGHHGAVLVDLGFGPETVNGILDSEPPGFDALDLLVRDYARLVAERAWGIRNQVVADLKQHFSNQQIVELTVRIGITILFNKLNQALQLDMEDAVSVDVRSKNIAAEPSLSGDDPGQTS